MEDKTSRSEFIKTITNPLGFYILSLLIVESTLSIILVASDLLPSDKAIGMYLVVGMFFIVSILVFLLVWFKPKNLTFDKKAHLDSDKSKAIYNSVNQTVKETYMGYKESAVKDVENLNSRIKNDHCLYSVTDNENFQDVLVVVDVQNDFFPNGSLPVPEAESLIQPLNEAIKYAKEAGFLIIFTQDWHPINHSSFEDNEGDWKPHCIKETNGAALHPDLFQPYNAQYVRFGVEPELDGYSPYENPLMDQLINNIQIRRVYITGIALEYCVYATCKQTRERNKETIAIDTLIRAASPKKASETWKKFDKINVIRQAAISKS